MSAGTRVTAVPERTRWAPVAALGLAMLAVTSEMTVAAVALPALGADLGVGPGATAWVLLAYTLPMAALGIPARRWGDRADSRPVFLAALAGITVGTALTVLAPNLAVLLAARLVQGVAGALVIAVYMPIVTASVRPDQRGRAISLIIMIMTVGTMAGAPAGGLIADQAGWRAVFLVKAPVVLVAAVCGWFALRGRRLGVPSPDRGLWSEALLLGGAIAAALLVFEYADGPWWAPVAAGAAAIGLGAGWLRLPAADAVRALVRRPAFGSTLIALFTVSLTSGLVAFGVPFLVADVLGASAGTSGTVLLFFVGAVAVGSPFGGWLADLFGPLRVAVAAGGLTVLALVAVLTVGADVTAAGLAWRMAVFGLAGGLFNPAINAATLAASPPGAEGATGGIAMTVRTVAAAVGPATAALCWTLAGGGIDGFRLGVLVLLVAVVAGVAAVLRPTLRTAPAPGPGLTGPVRNREARVVGPDLA